jgi:monofunctional biosynthetic peptidoglycan transglycosylase
MRKSKIHVRKVLRWIVMGHLIFVLFIAIMSVFLTFFDPPYTTLMIYRNIFSGIPNRPHYSVDINNIPRRYLRLLVYAEDPTFNRHHGIDIPSILSAYETNEKYGRLLYGGSTLTQQLARTIFLFPEKLYIRKYLEMWIALTMECVIPKQRILELYLNYAEWGRGIYGIQSASYYYYGAAAYRVGDDNVLRLLTLLPSPCRYTPFSFENREVLRMRYAKLTELLGIFYSKQ